MMETNYLILTDQVRDIIHSETVAVVFFLIHGGLRIFRNNFLNKPQYNLERLLSGVAGAVDHNIIELPVWLGVQLVKYHRMDVESIFLFFMDKFQGKM